MREVYGVRLPEQEQKRVEMLIKMGYYLNTGDFLRDAVRSKLEEFEIVIPRAVKLRTAKREIFKLVRAQPNLYADEIAASLNLDIETVIRAIDELIKEKKVTA